MIKFHKRSLIAASLSVMSTLFLSWAALFCLNSALQVFGYVEHGSVPRQAFLVLTMSFVAVLVRYFPTSVRQEKLSEKFDEIAATTYANTVSEFNPVLVDLLIHLNRLKLEISSEDFDKDHVLYLIEKAIEEAKEKQNTLQSAKGPDKLSGFSKVKL